MDEQLIRMAEQLQLRIEELKVHADEDTLIWVHGFLRELLKRIETATPALKAKILRQDLDEAAQALKRLTAKMDFENDSDSLDRMERELGGEDPHAGGPRVPARPKLGPKSLRGGVALPLPD